MNNDELSTVRRTLPWLWAGAFLITAIFGYAATPWDAISHLLGNAGKVDDDGAQLIAFAACYTLPATLGFGLLAWFGIRDMYKEFGPYGSCAVVGLTLGGTAVACQQIGLGLLPDWEGATGGQLPGYLRFPAYVLSAYLNEYGWGLMLTAAAIGGVLALQFEVWRQGVETS